MNTRDKSRKAIFLFIIHILILLPYSKVLLSNDYILLARDITNTYLGSKFHWRQSIIEFGAIPFWDYSTYAGYPSLADPNTSMFHPLNWIFLLFSKENFFYAYSWFTAAQSIVLFWGFYFLMRSLRVNTAVSAIFSLAICWCGTTLSTFNTVNILSAFSWMPWFMLALRSFFQKPNLLRGLLLSLTIGMPVLVGDPQFSYWFGIFFLLSFFTPLRHKAKISWALAILPLSIMFCSIQAIPTLFEMQHSNRGNLHGISLTEAQWLSLHPLRLLEFLTPLPYGSYVPEHNYWGGRFTDKHFQQPFIFTYYIGSITFFLLLLAVLRKNRSIAHFKRNLHPQKIFPFLLSFSIFWLALGKYAPISLYAFFYKMFPLWSLFRYPERFVLPITFLLISYACLEANFLFRSFYVQRKIFLKNKFKLLLCSFVFISLVNALVAWKAKQLEWETISQSLLHTNVLLSVTLLCLFYIALKNKKIWLLSLFCLLPLDLYTKASRIIWPSPQEITAKEENIIFQKVSSDLDKRKEEINKGAAHRYTSALINPNELKPLDSPSSRKIDIVTKLIAKQWATIAPNTHYLFSIDTQGGYASIEPTEIVNFWTKHRKDHVSELLNLFSVRYLGVQNPDGTLGVKANLSTLPYIYTPATIIPVSSPKEAEAKVFSHTINASQIILEKVTATQENGNPTKMGQINKIEQKPDALTVYLNAPLQSPVILAWSERYDPHWIAREAGTQLPLLRANAWSMATILPPKNATERIVQFSYENPSRQWGALLSLSWLMLLFFALFMNRKKSALKPASM